MTHFARCLSVKIAYFEEKSPLFNEFSSVYLLGNSRIFVSSFLYILDPEVLIKNIYISCLLSLLFSLK